MRRLKPSTLGWGIWLLMSAAAFLAALAAAPAHAQTLPTSTAGPSQFAVPISTVATLNVPQFAATAEICVEGAAARYTSDGQATPSATLGIPVASGTCFNFAGSLVNFKIIGAGATLDVEYFK
jgi:hypothetical protein